MGNDSSNRHPTPRSGKWKKGQQGGHTGRVKAGVSLPKLVRAKVDPSEVVGIVLAIARGHALVLDDGPVARALDTKTIITAPGEVRLPTAADRLRACEWLMARAYGRIPEAGDRKALGFEDGDGGEIKFDYSKLTDEQLRQLDELHQVALIAEPKKLP